MTKSIKIILIIKLQIYLFNFYKFIDRVYNVAIA